MADLHQGTDREITLSWKTILNRLGIPYKERSTGRIYALCVLHKEKTPSLVFYPDSGRYKCYGCGYHGTKLDFLRKIYEPYNIRTDEDICAEIRDFGIRWVPDPNQIEIPF